MGMLDIAGRDRLFMQRNWRYRIETVLGLDGVRSIVISLVESNE